MIITTEPRSPGWTPGPLDEPGRRRTRRWPPLLAAAVTMIAALWWISAADDPTTIGGSRLAGPRLPGALNIVVLMDYSGSFQQYTPIREQTLQEVVSWSGGNLSPDDTVTVIGFAGNARVIMPTTKVAELDQKPVNTTVAYTDGTAVIPALAAVDSAITNTNLTSLIVVTDTVIQDADPSTIDQLVSDLHTTSMTVITPNDIDVAPEWSAIFPYELVVSTDNGSSADTSLALARAIAHGTGQQLVKT